jgi:transposase
MPRRNKHIRLLVARLDDIIKEYKKENPSKKRNYRTYEQEFAKRAKACFHNLEPLVTEAISNIKIIRKDNRGAISKLTLKQKVLLLLLKQLCQKSNRNMEFLLVVFALLTNIEISYKTIERLYSDVGVQIALFNIHSLILAKKGITTARCSGDGTGYTVIIQEHYATIAQKLKDKAKSSESCRKKQIVYSFSLLDIDNRMYIGYGTSYKSEKEAFENALMMAKKSGIDVMDLRLDRYYSSAALHNLAQKYLGKVKVYLIPKKNIVHIGIGDFSKMMFEFVNDVYGYLKHYFQRNKSESCFAEDKKRTGWRVAQKIEQRIDTAIFANNLWHNMYWLKIEI